MNVALRALIISPVPVLLPLTILRIVGKIQCRNDKAPMGLCKIGCAIGNDSFL